MFEYNCPHCDSEMEGSFGDDVHCEKCDLTFKTEWDYVGDYSPVSWLVGDGKKKQDVVGVFKSVNELNITGRGKVLVVVNDRDLNNPDNWFVGKNVIVDDEVYLVRGIEVLNKNKGDLIGLLVREIIEDEN